MFLTQTCAPCQEELLQHKTSLVRAIVNLTDSACKAKVAKGEIEKPFAVSVDSRALRGALHQLLDRQGT